MSSKNRMGLSSFSSLVSAVLLLMAPAARAQLAHSQISFLILAGQGVSPGSGTFTGTRLKIEPLAP